MNFEFATAGRIIFGSGTAQQIAPLAAKMGTRALVVTDARVEGAQAIIEQLNQHGLECLTFEVDCEPTTDLIKSGAGQARQAQHNLVIGIGGGSVLDTGKAIAAMLTNKGELEDYLEVVGKGQPLTEPPVAYIAVPTTAGTGAEVTRNAVLAVPKHGVKVSMRSPLMLPRVAVVDPVLTYSMPPPVTASTGLDALTQVMEPYVSNKSNPLTDGICREGLTRAARSLKRAYEDGTNAAAREDMSLASLFGGLALANAKLGAVHGFAGPLGGMIHAPHGVICARLLPHVMEVNVRVLQSRTPDSPALARYDQVARLLTGTATAKAPDGVAWVQGLCEVLKVPPLADFGLKQQDFPTAVAKAQKASSMKGNPITLTEAELTEILTKAA
ncbi:MAG: iron-containing alcohol dehydrogenase [Planctomycetota bacterium]|jgi:alcohol dehydrogenase class IV